MGGGGGDPLPPKLDPLDPVDPPDLAATASSTRPAPALAADNCATDARADDIAAVSDVIITRNGVISALNCAAIAAPET